MALAEIHLKIEGMSCGHCERTVANAVRSLDGITSVHVDLKSGIGTVVFNDALVSPAQILAAVEDTGMYQGRVITG